MQKYKTIGILGGMGPEATAELYLRIIKSFQKEYGAIYDSDFPEIIILNLPIPDVVENTNEQKGVQEMLVKGAEKLEKAGVDFIAVPCNTVTYYIKDIQGKVSTPIINLLEETAKNIMKKEIKTIGLLGTETTIKSEIYNNVLRNTSIITLEKEDQIETTKIIMNILAGDKNIEDEKRLLEFIQKLKEKGAEKVILGCTELPLLIKNNKETIDTLDILTKSIIKKTIKLKKDLKQLNN